EADELCDRIGVIARGKIVALDTPKGLKSLVKDTSVIEVEGFGITERDLDSLKALDGVRTVTANMCEDKQTMRVQVGDPVSLLSKVAHLLEDRKVIGMKVKEPTLEDAYLWLVREDA
ncbi:MAG TPA: ABC transporter ATP-binding protein, partial [Methanomassiliicoccales archaeon]|nr:ABC transporter ATP-binding protein [Methanomassiliicoccales archaeon]